MPSVRKCSIIAIFRSGASLSKTPSHTCLAVEPLHIHHAVFVKGERELSISEKRQVCIWVFEAFLRKDDEISHIPG